MASHTISRRIRVAVVLTLFVAVLAFAFALPSLASSLGGNATVNSGPAYVYATSYLGSPVIAQLSTGTRVQVTSYNANWAEVSLGGSIGYVVTSYLTFDSVTPAPLPTYSPPGVIATATVNSGPLNVHSYASLSAPVISQLSTGARVSLSSYTTSWAGVILGNGQVGYVVTSYLNIGTQPPSVTARPTEATHEKVQTSGANATITTDNRGPLHLRAAASFDAAILETYANGSRVEVMSLKGGWYYVKAGTNVGYMDTEYVTVDGGVSIEGTGDGYEAVVNNPSDGEILHLRQEPSTQSATLGSYRNGTYVEVLGYGTEWMRVVVDGKTGYMMSEYIRITTPNATPDRTVSGTAVKLYSSKSTSSNVLTDVTNGSIVTVRVPEELWSKVSYTENGTTQTGYVQNEFLAEMQPVVSSFVFTGSG